MKQKYYVELSRQEWRLIIEALNRLRNKLIAAGRQSHGSLGCGDGGSDDGKVHYR